MSLSVRLALDEAGELTAELLRELARAELVDELHGDGATFSSAMPAWQRRRSPATTGSTSSIATCSRAPPTSTVAVAPSTSTTVAVDGNVAAGDAVIGVERHPAALARISLHLLLVRLAHLLEQLERLACLSSSIRSQGEADVDEHPVADAASGQSAIETARRTPEISAFASPASGSTSSTICAGIPRHMRRSSSLRLRPGRSLCRRRSAVRDGA